MAIDEAMRHRIHGKLEALLGSDEAAAVMSAITEADGTRESIGRVEAQVSELRSEIHKLYRWTVGSIFAAVSLGLAAGQLIH
jgi:hypothetical protein